MDATSERILQQQMIDILAIKLTMKMIISVQLLNSVSDTRDHNAIKLLSDEMKTLIMDGAKIEGRKFGDAAVSAAVLQMLEPTVNQLFDDAVRQIERTAALFESPPTDTRN